MRQKIAAKTNKRAIYLFVAMILMAAVVSPGFLLQAETQEQAQAEEVEVGFISPRHDDIWIGNKNIEVRVVGVKPEFLRSVSIYLDGKLLKEFNSPPFRFDYDFGLAPKNRELEVLVRQQNQRLTRSKISSYHIDDSQEIDVLQVMVPIVVTDRRGNYVANLKKEDFTILEDGVPQEIAYFSKSGQSAFHLVLLIDISSSMRDKIQKVKEVAKEFLQQLMSKGDQAIIIFFNHEVFEDSDFTNNIHELENAISIAFPFGTTALYDAVAYSVKLMKSIIGHNIIILFSDGEDNSSSIDPYTLIDIVERSNSVIYSIGRKTNTQENDQYQEILQKISHSSGGITFFLESVREIQKVYRRIRQDIKAQFLLRFSPGDNKKRSRFRKITVKINNKKGYKVRTMKGYYY